MTTHLTRMKGRDARPSPESIAAFLGKSAYTLWQQVVARIEEDYPRVFVPGWIYGGDKYGWALRYKKSRSFCTLIPEAKSFSIQIVFGRDERKKMEGVAVSLRKRTRDIYDAATVYHDGKWLFLPVDSAETIEEIFRMLAIKRKPKKRPDLG